MKEWLIDHKYYIAAALAVALGFLYYSNRDTAPTDIIAASTVESEEGMQETPPVPDSTTILIDVKGAVEKPGVYHASPDERVIDIIELAGGLSESADTSGVNFAQKLQDEMIVYVPAKGEEAGSTASGTDVASGNGKININRANETELQEIPGIGPSKAAAIIEYREKNGPFKKPEELKEISGIGDKTFEKLEGAITVH
ncbi:helix-hairpin-helix domain-containing protein [Bacillus sp. EB01]|uniref:helix-hairpin-helix domain-containing protein n=1 Tax=Bacillus sp. EB01 TaxID=1347086 RepID=UPI0005C4F649|nr:helix-hairpin-helix domain-containing protein [Bacillus sp. EB01]